MVTLSCFYSDIKTSIYTEVINLKIDEYISINKTCEKDCLKFCILMVVKINERLSVKLPDKDIKLFSLISSHIHADTLRKINLIKT